MTIIKNSAQKFRLYPTKSQSKRLQLNLWASRKHYNVQVAHQKMVRQKYLAGDKDAYKNNRKTIKMKDARLEIATEFPQINDADSNAGSFVLLQINSAMQTFRRLCKSGEYRAKRDKGTGAIIQERGFPRFKSVFDTTQSYTTKPTAWEFGKVKLPKIGWVKVNQHRALPDCAVIKSATISWTPTGKYYIAYTLESPADEVKRVAPNKILAITYDRERGFLDSEGRTCDKVDWLRELLPEIASLQNSLKAKDRGSTKDNRKPSASYNRTRIKLARYHERAKNRRKEYHHQLSYRLANNYDAILIDGSNIRDDHQMQGEGLEFSDIGFGMLREMLKYKLDDRGKTFIEVKTKSQTAEERITEILEEGMKRLNKTVEVGKRRHRERKNRFQKRVGLATQTQPETAG